MAITCRVFNCIELQHPTKHTYQRLAMAKTIPNPKFAYETEVFLERGDEEFKKPGKPLPLSKVRGDILTSWLWLCLDMKPIPQNNKELMLP